MKKSTRIFSAVLAGLLLMSAVSCSSGTDSKETSKETAGGQTSGETTAETEEETKKYLDDIPDNVKFDGDTVSFLASFTSSSIALLDNDDPTEVVNDAVYNRNLIIGERLGVNIEIARGATTGYGEFNSVVTNAVAAGTEEFDVLCGHTRFNINLASQGILKNLDNINYIDLSKEYWSQGYDNNISYDNIHYWATGDLSIEYIGYIYAMFVNSAMWNDHYSDTDIYSVVKEGKWTLDKLAEYAENVYVDVNGNGEVDNDDSFGVVMQKGHVLNGMAFASNVVYTSYDENGTPYISVNNEHTIDVFNKRSTHCFTAAQARECLKTESLTVLPRLCSPPADFSSARTSSSLPETKRFARWKTISTSFPCRNMTKIRKTTAPTSTTEFRFTVCRLRLRNPSSTL